MRTWKTRAEIQKKKERTSNIIDMVFFFGVGIICLWLAAVYVSPISSYEMRMITQTLIIFLQIFMLWSIFMILASIKKEIIRGGKRL